MRSKIRYPDYSPKPAQTNSGNFFLRQKIGENKFSWGLITSNLYYEQFQNKSYTDFYVEINLFEFGDQDESYNSAAYFFMIRIGLISDTHSYFDPDIPEYFKDCDEIWHAGDFGVLEIADKLRKIAPLKGVYGNIDGQDIRQEFPHDLRFTSEGVDVFMTHIGGNPGRYALPIRNLIETNPPKLLICGHSHILKVARDPDNRKMLYINPGAAGRHGFQVMRTIMRFELHNGAVQNVEVINLGSR